MAKLNYNSIIPEKVRHDKSLPASAKILYGELFSLSNVQGYCDLTNRKLAEKFDVHKNTISMWLSKLARKGYIEIEIIKRDNQVIGRKIYPLVKERM